MNTCKECKWWKRQDTNFGTCLYSTLENVEGETILYVGGEERGQARLTVHRNYGCIHWEEKAKGPFSVNHSTRWRWSVIYGLDDPRLPRIVQENISLEAEARKLCAKLNALWAERRRSIMKAPYTGTPDYVD